MDTQPKNELGEQNETLQEKPSIEQNTVQPEIASESIAEQATPATIPVSPTNNYHEINAEPKPARHRHYKYIIAGLLIVLAFALGVFGTLIYTKKHPQNSQTSNTVQPIVTPAAVSDSSKTPATPVKETIKWLDTPVKMAIQPVYTDQWFKETFQNPGNSYQPKVEDVLNFYQVGSIGDDQLIVATVSDGPGGTTNFFKKSGNSYTLYQQHSTSFYAVKEGGTPEYFGPPLTAAVQIDKTSQMTDIVQPESIKIGNQKLIKSEYNVMGVDFISTKEPSNQYTKYSFSKSTPEGTLYEATTKEESSYKVSYYTLMTKDHRMHPYILDNDIFKINITQPIVWNNGVKNTLKYGSAVGGCSFSRASEIAKNITDASVEASGKASDGTIIYTIKDLNDPLMVKHYNEYKDITKYDNQLPADEKNMTAQQFKQKNGIYLAKDGSDRWIVMTNPNYFPSGGCAKPVVYLYPTLATLVNVGVGADVTKSEPYYSEGGWKGVLAQPNGSLQYLGQTYDSLFWEGYGKGAYPEITSGSFVKRQDAEQRIKSDLAKQGLNNKEISDFWAFWSAKLPNKEFVRITWLGNSQLQKLAPLHVSPKPDTMIRVFLDMEGVDAPYPLAEQSLFAPNRNGFTVVEWGGLARDGTVPKLQ